jgi:DNA-binding response OmpR family regulator
VELNKEHILVVDDEEDLRHVIVELLTLEGFEVDACATAEQAAEKLARTAYDVLVTDLMLPGKSGVQLMEDSRRRHEEGRVRLSEQTLQTHRTSDHDPQGIEGK